MRDEWAQVGVETNKTHNPPQIRAIYMDRSGRKRYGLWHEQAEVKKQADPLGYMVASDAEQVRITPAGRAVLGKQVQDGG